MEQIEAVGKEERKRDSSQTGTVPGKNRTKGMSRQTAVCEKNGGLDMKKRSIALLLTAVLVTGSLAGCGSEPDNSSSGANDSTQDTQQSTEESSSEEQSEEDPGTAAGDRTITISTQNTEGEEAGWKAVAEAYMDKHPDVTVVVDLKPSDGYDQWATNVFNNNETTSVDIVNINLAAEAASGKSINYADYMENDSPYSNGPWKEQFEYDMQTVDAGTGSFNALSLQSVKVLWLYNQDIFDEAEVDIPTTWAELIDVCEKIQAKGYQPIAMPGDYDSFYSGTMGWLAQVYADQTTRSTIDIWRSQPGDYTYDPTIDDYYTYDPSDPFNDDTTKVTRNPVRFFAAVKNGDYTAITPGMKTVWSSFADVFPKYAGNEVMFGTNKEGAKTLFYQGKAAMYVDGGWGIVQFANDMAKIASGQDIELKDGSAMEGVVGFTLGTFDMPSMEGEGIEAKARTIEVSNGFLGAVSKSQDHDDLVMDFMMFYSSSEGMSLYMDAAIADGLAPSGPSLVYGVQYPDEIQNAFKNLTMIGNVQKSYGQSLARGFAEIPESYRAFYDYCLEFLQGKIDVDAFLQKHQANIDEHFETGMTNSKITLEDLENPANEPTGE